ncbi:MAG: superoxide dismutase [Burkholderiales bacterium]|nr:superoxide dismutase [Burkholderiales bacterium]
MKHMLPPLPYGPAALEPHIDARTMTLHHDMHHASYVEKLNAALEKFPELQERTPTWLLRNRGKIPEAARTAVHNNAGGHVNHSMLWRAMSPQGGGEPSGVLADAIRRDFGSFDGFKVRFNDAGGKLFGSGWVWLVSVRQDGGKLQVETTTGHDNPLTQGHFPLLVNDVWEHAYYLKHQNRRPEYLEGWWAVANWEEAARRFELARASAEEELQDEAGLAVATMA